jgi:hypothetical protein
MMPTVGGKKFPYTKKGMAQAKKKGHMMAMKKMGRKK